LGFDLLAWTWGPLSLFLLLPPPPLLGALINGVCQGFIIFFSCLFSETWNQSFLLFANCHFDNCKWFNISKASKIFESSKTLFKNLTKSLQRIFLKIKIKIRNAAGVN
jgi:hypothetical protein